MCRYSYKFHSACRHYSSMVVEYCEKAEPVALTSSSSLRRRTSLQDFRFSEDMPTLPLFPAGGFRQWMAGTGPPLVTAPMQSYSPVRRREEGIRGTDESGGLHDSEAVLQHPTAHSRSTNDYHVGTDGRRITSYGSTTAASDVEKPVDTADFDTIEVEIDIIKAEVQHVRATAEEKHRNGELAGLGIQHGRPTRTESSKIPAPVNDPSTAAHSSAKFAVFEDSASSGKASKSTNLSKRSYAQTVTGKLHGTVTRDLVSRQTVANTASPASNESSASFGGFLHDPDSSTSQSTTQSTYFDAAEYLQSMASSPEISTTTSGQSSKSSPHFAQLTQAASRRVDQTLRKDSTLAKLSPETTPGRSTKANAPNFETDKRAAQRQSKRTSLPEGWMSTPEHPSSTERSGQRKEHIIPGVTASSSPAEQTSSPLRKKTSSYMSPTKAAQHRTVATIGQDSPKRLSPKTHMHGLRIDTAVANQALVRSHASPLRKGPATGSDDIFCSPKSYPSSKASSKRAAASPKKGPASRCNSIQATSDRPSSPMRLPLPLPYVENTTVTHGQSSDHLLNHIKEKLDKEDLLRHNLTQEPDSFNTSRISHSGAPEPDYTRLSKSEAPAARAFRAVDQALYQQGQKLEAGIVFEVAPSSPRSHGDDWRAARHPRVRDPNSEPISRLITGLRGQNSADIGKALGGGQHDASRSRNVSTQEDQENQNPAIINRSHKPSDYLLSPQDPAILYKGRKPSGSISSQSDPAILLSIGPAKLEVPSQDARSRRGSQPSSLRATALDFVPSFATNDVSRIEPLIQASEVTQTDDWQQIGPSQPLDGLSQFFGPPAVPEASCSLPNHGQNPYSTWHGQSAPRWNETPPTAPHLPPLFHYVPRFPDQPSGMDRTPSISPTSGDTSPPLSLDSSQRASSAWSIAGKGRRKYLWTGSDGLEIGFRGHGPDAEHDPNSPVMYRDYRANTNTYHLQAASYPRSHMPGSPLPPSAPKSMREYAEKMGLSHVPCLHDQWLGRYDSLPAVLPVSGVCSCCKSGDRVLQGMGGGIDPVAQY